MSIRTFLGVLLISGTLIRALAAHAAAAVPSIIDATTTANNNYAYHKLLERADQDLIQALERETGGKLSQDGIDKVRQQWPFVDKPLALHSRYDFHMDESKASDIKILAGFPTPAIGR
jgi:hypothetical protein